MTAQILTSELTNLIQESKRKNSDLRNAAEKSLNDLKAYTASPKSEIQLAEEDLSQKPGFIVPFLKACGTKNPKFTGIAVVCLQRLIVSKALPPSTLKEVLEALREATSLGIDIQLKILQALPPLLQNFSNDLRGELLADALLICSILQSSKNGVVNHTAAATLQQLVVAVFENVASGNSLLTPKNDKSELNGDGLPNSQAIALDAYRVFNDLCLLTESEKPQFLQIATIPQAFGLELIESILTNHADVFLSHEDLGKILRIRLMPLIIKCLSERLNFPITVRATRVLYILLRNHLSILAAECEVALSLLTHLLDPEPALPWKRALCMEVFRGIYAEPGLTRKIYALFDEQEGKANILRNHVATLVRLASEKPKIIGLGLQSTVPTRQPTSKEAIGEQAALEAAGVTGFMGGVMVAVDANAPGISSQWSSMRVPCIDQLDKIEPPSLPESYLYSLALTCINNFSEGLAKFILPLTIPQERGKRRNRTQATLEAETLPNCSDEAPDSQLAGKEPARKRSVKRGVVPLNPLTLDPSHPLFSDIKTCAGIVETCWPAVLATCSTFFNAALDSEFYHSLVRAFQKFAHVAGLLRLNTPRDAFLTTLGKAAVPPQAMVANALFSPVTPSVEGHSIFANAKGLLSVDSLASPSITSSERGRPSTVEIDKPTLNTRNLLCLRALLNLGIALGPTLDTAWSIILETLQQADYIIFASSFGSKRPSSANMKDEGRLGSETPSLLANFGGEIKAVETAATRLFESTIDFPNESFVEMIRALCNLLGEVNSPTPEESLTGSLHSPLRPTSSHRKMASVSGLTTAISSQVQEDHFVLAKLGEVASINIYRLTRSNPSASGWDFLTKELVSLSTSTNISSAIRLRAAEILSTILLEAATSIIPEPENIRSAVQMAILSVIETGIDSLHYEDRRNDLVAFTSDVEVHKIGLEALRAVLEQCGESIVAGWEIIFDIISSAFNCQENKNAYSSHEDSESDIPEPFFHSRSPKLVRSSYASLNLICSDFLAALPSSCILVLIDTLFSFCSQEDDLNISLSTITFFWNVSDFLQVRSESFSLDQGAAKLKGESDLIESANNSDEQHANAALWMLLLLRLASVIRDERLEVRNGAVQTILRIFDAYGNKLGPEAWGSCLKIIIFKMMQPNTSRMDQPNLVDRDAVLKGWDETTILILNGVSDLFANFLDIFVLQTDFPTSWQALIQYLESLISRNSLEVNTAVFAALQRILSKVAKPEQIGLASVDLVWNIWTRGIPVDIKAAKYPKSTNQDTLISYVRSFREIYRLISDRISIKHIERILALLRKCIHYSDNAIFSADTDYLTGLQSQVIDTLKYIRTDIEGAPSIMIKYLAGFAILAFNKSSSEASGDRRITHIALCRSSINLAQAFVIENIENGDLFTSSAISEFLEALAVPITLKYSCPSGSKGPRLWKLATNTSLAIVESALPHLSKASMSEQGLHRFWNIIVKIAGGIVSADCTKADRPDEIGLDEEFDVDVFRKLRKLIIPSLGASIIPDHTRRTYMEWMFTNSILHEPYPGELPQPGAELLEGLYTHRLGSTTFLPECKRRHVSYTCLDELFSLVRKDSGSPEAVRLAQAAAPFLILRAGLTLRAFISDQPLRGRMPQPLTQRKELLHILKSILELKSEPRAIPPTPGATSQHKKHIQRLSPLISRAIPVARHDHAVLGLLTLAMDEIIEEFGVL
ncbi:MAG: hypothetical protein M1829_000140 [Trizodia sp. TS-e1964]|nr:MAG: hypothetical protein M1829_000140 [Trizodia sp. TS-e1964]